MALPLLRPDPRFRLLQRGGSHRPRHRAGCTLLQRLVVAAVAVAAALLQSEALGQEDAQASPWRAAIIVSETGAGALGQRHAYAAQRALAAAGAAGIYGQPLGLELHDDRGDPRRAEQLAEAAVDAGALAVVCCTTAAATDRVARVAEAGGVVLLALDAARTGEGDWTMQLAPSARTVMTAAAVHAAAEGKAALALMTVDTAFGDDAEASFERAVLDTGRDGLGVVRYPSNATVLTPEGLDVAAREPGSVIVWGLPDDTPHALGGLRRRGYLGPVYVRPASLPDAAWARLGMLDALETPVIPSRDDPWLGVRVAVPPVAVHGMLPPEHPNARSVAAALARLGGATVTSRPAPELVDMAIVDDAVQLLLRAFQDVAALGLPPGLPAVGLRLAVRDALHSAAPAALAAGTYAPRAGDTRAARWDGLVLVTLVR